MKQILMFILICSAISNCFANDSLKVVPKKSFDMLQIKTDSVNFLEIITCGNYVYFPFGYNQKREESVLQVLNHFSDSIVNYPYADTVLRFHSLKYRSSHLLLFFDNDPEAEVSSYILKGQVLDKSIPLVNGIHIGMTIESFLKKFFNRFPNRWATNLDTIVFDSCVEGIKHIYRFSNHRLVQVRFEPVGIVFKI